MTTREQIEAKYKEVVGRKARKDYSDESLIKKIEEVTGQKFTIAEEHVKEEPKKEPVDSGIPDVQEPEKVEEVAEQITDQNKTLKQYKNAEDEVDEFGNLIFRGRDFDVPRGEHLVYLDGGARYFTKATMPHAIATFGDRLKFPSNSRYQQNASENKCKDC